MSIEIAFIEEMAFALNDISAKNKFAPGTDSFFPRSVTILGVLTNLPILVSKWCQDCQIAIKFIRDTQKGVGLAFVELIWYFIALYADKVT